jgi:hypothetical protein
MSGETQLNVLLTNLTPALDTVEYVFVSLASPTLPLLLVSIGMFKESEGVTLILPKNAAEKFGLAFNTTFEHITLMVHSSLSAIGLLAAVATALAKSDITCNAVAGFYHDHIFVQYGRGADAVTILKNLATV